MVPEPGHSIEDTIAEPGRSIEDAVAEPDHRVTYASTETRQSIEDTIEKGKKTNPRHLKAAGLRHGRRVSGHYYDDAGTGEQQQLFINF